MLSIKTILRASRGSRARIAIFIVAGVAGCASPVIGDWQSTAVQGINGERNEMKLNDDESGQATIYFYEGDAAYVADFDIEWEDRGDDFRIDMECDDCVGIDFVMDCEVEDDGEMLECKADGVFRYYDFEWERNE